MELRHPIRTPEELFDNMAMIHLNASQLTNEPHVPILCERNIEIELTFMRHEHYMEHETLSNFNGISPEAIENIMNITYHRDQIIADIDGKGHVNKTIQHPNTGFEPIINHYLQQKTRFGI